MGNKVTASEWVGLAWKLRLKGVSYEAIGKQLSKDRDTVRRQLKGYSQALAAARAESGEDPLEAYLSGLEEDLMAAANLAQDRGMGSTLAARVGAHKLVVDIRKLIAAALGVVTERKAQELNLTTSWNDLVMAAWAKHGEEPEDA
jgi:hypothetical protein